MKAEIVDHLGNIYPSLKDMCIKYKVPLYMYEERINSGWSLKDALVKSAYRSKNSTVDHLGNVYENVTSMCKAYGISYSTFRTRVMNNGWTLKAALTFSADKTFHITLNKMPERSYRTSSWFDDFNDNGGTEYPELLNNEGTKYMDYLGIEYDTINDMCKAYGIDYKSFCARYDRGVNLLNALNASDHNLFISPNYFIVNQSENERSHIYLSKVVDNISSNIESAKKKYDSLSEDEKQSLRYEWINEMMTKERKKTKNTEEKILEKERRRLEREKKKEEKLEKERREKERKEERREEERKRRASYIRYKNAREREEKAIAAAKQEVKERLRREKYNRLKAEKEEDSTWMGMDDFMNKYGYNIRVEYELSARLIRQKDIIGRDNIKLYVRNAYNNIIDEYQEFILKNYSVSSDRSYVKLNGETGEVIKIICSYLYNKYFDVLTKFHKKNLGLLSCRDLLKLLSSEMGYTIELALMEELCDQIANDIDDNPYFDSISNINIDKFDMGVFRCLCNIRLLNIIIDVLIGTIQFRGFNGYKHNTDRLMYTLLLYYDEKF